jgi:hypothetical protein
MMQFLVATATAHPEEFFDNGFLKKIEESGFTKGFQR